MNLARYRWIDKSKHTKRENDWRSKARKKMEKKREQETWGLGMSLRELDARDSLHGLSCAHGTLCLLSEPSWQYWILTRLAKLCLHLNHRFTKRVAGKTYCQIHKSQQIVTRAVRSWIRPIYPLFTLGQYLGLCYSQTVAIKFPAYWPKQIKKS